MNEKRAFSCAVVLMFASLTASAQTQLPSETDLRAAYCLPVLQKDIDSIEKMIALTDDQIKHIEDMPESSRQGVLQMLQKSKQTLPQTLSERRSSLNRVQLFILPRMQYLDASALLGATARGTADTRELEEKVSACQKDCGSHTSADDFTGCANTCIGRDLMARLNACRNPMWLPF